LEFGTKLAVEKTGCRNNGVLGTMGCQKSGLTPWRDIATNAE